jgi:excisionase family DNA binding protein
VVITATEEFLSPEEVGGRLGVSVYTVRRWVKTGQLRAFKPGKEYRIQKSDLEEFLRAREVRPKAPRRSPSEPSFNDVLAEERRESGVHTAGAHMEGQGSLHAYGRVRVLRIASSDLQAVIRGAMRGEFRDEEEAMAAALEKAETT